MYNAVACLNRVLHRAQSGMSHNLTAAEPFFHCHSKLKANKKALPPVFKHVDRRMKAKSSRLYLFMYHFSNEHVAHIDP